MHPSRGDRRPCSAGDCDGTMQFGRRRQNGSGSSTAPKPNPETLDDTGWICSSEPDHFTAVPVGLAAVHVAAARTAL